LIILAEKSILYLFLHKSMRYLRDNKSATIAFLFIIAITASVELSLGRSFFGPDGKFGFWEGNIWSSENSQRFADPYSFSHLAHGILFFVFL